MIPSKETLPLLTIWRFAIEDHLRGAMEFVSKQTNPTNKAYQEGMLDAFKLTLQVVQDDKFAVNLEDIVTKVMIQVLNFPSTNPTDSSIQAIVTNVLLQTAHRTFKESQLK
jgi:hypothetical protein